MRYTRAVCARHKIKLPRSNRALIDILRSLIGRRRRIVIDGDIKSTTCR